MNEGLIPNRYAKALYQYASAQGQSASVYEQTARLADSYGRESKLAKAVENPFLSVADKTGLLLAASGAEQEGCLDKFFRLVFSHGRETLMLSMALAYGKKYREANRISQVEIVTASELPAGSMDSIRKTVQAHLGDRTLEYRERVEPSLIGGFTVRVDSQLIDASMSNELRKLRLKLLSKK